RGPDRSSRAPGPRGVSRLEYPPPHTRRRERTLMAGFEQLDFRELEDQYTEDERMVRDTVRQFVQERVLPTIEHHFREGTFPTHLIGEMAEMGLLGANLEGYGCAGLGAVAYGLIMQELERGDSGVRSFVSVQGALV